MHTSGCHRCGYEKPYEPPSPPMTYHQLALEIQRRRAYDVEGRKMGAKWNADLPRVLAETDTPRTRYMETSRDAANQDTSE